VFHHPGWLNAVCGNDWDIALCYDKNDNVQAALPYFQEKKAGFTLLRQPYLTPYLGPLIQYPKRQTKLSYIYGHEKKVIEELVKALPKFSYFNQKCHFDFQNGQPFYWNDFEVHTNYTYVVNLDQSYKDIESAFEGKVRTSIRKAEESLICEQSDDLERFFRLNEQTFHHQDMESPYTMEHLLALDNFLASVQKRSILVVKDKSDRWHAAIYLVYDRGTAYTLMIASDPELRKSGAIAYAVSNAIRQAKKDSSKLDFCGSMEERFQRVFRSFGAKQQANLRIMKKQGAAFKTMNSLTGKGT